jgi:hypothetical protein
VVSVELNLGMIPGQERRLVALKSGLAPSHNYWHAAGVARA